MLDHILVKLEHEGFFFWGGGHFGSVGLHSGSLNQEPLGLASSALTTRPLLAGIFEQNNCQA